MSAMPKAPREPVAKAPMQAGDHLILVDGSGFIFRAFHALPPMTRKSDGLPTSAVLGFCNMVWKMLQEGPTPQPGDEPTHFAVIFDYSAKSFRREIYPDYKAHRPEPPSDLVPQFGLIRQATRAFNLACLEQEGWEADDLIATYVKQASGRGASVTIVSSDKDLMQLVQPGVQMVDTMKNVVIDREGVKEKFGVYPEKMIELQALVGNSTDNVPGVPGIGPKTAAQLLDEYGDLETLLLMAKDIKQQKRRENLIAVRRAGAHLAPARGALLRRAARRAARRPGGRSRSTAQGDRLLQGDGVHRADRPRRVEDRRRSRRSRGGNAGDRRLAAGGGGAPAHGPDMGVSERPVPVP